MTLLNYDTSIHLLSSTFQNIELLFLSLTSFQTSYSNLKDKELLINFPDITNCA